MKNILKLDLVDRKILTLLDWDARVSNSEIAKEVRLSKKSVEYRIKRLERLGVIQRYYPLIDFGRLGYRVNRIELILQNMNEKVKKEIEDFVIKDEDIHWAIWLRGSCDLGFDIWTKDQVHFKKVLNRFFSHFGQYIKKRRITHSIGFEHYPYQFILGKKSNNMVYVGETKDTAKIEALDEKILLELVKNARQTASEIARKLNISYKTVIYRMNNLRKNKVLIGSRALINEGALGYDYYKFIFYFDKYSDSLHLKFKEYFKKKLETVYIVDHIDSDFDVEIILKSDDEMFSLLDKINEDFPGVVREVEYWKFIKTIKVVYLPNLYE